MTYGDSKRLKETHTDGENEKRSDRQIEKEKYTYLKEMKDKMKGIDSEREIQTEKERQRNR